MSDFPGVEVIHRDEDLLVLYKPPGIATTSEDGRNCLTEIAHSLDPRAPRLHPSSRLDKEVSGLVTFARTTEAIQALLYARKRHQYERTYIALAQGVPADASGSWDASIGIDPKDKRKRVAHDSGSAAKSVGLREAHTDYAVRCTLPEPNVTLLELHPRTGRTHQLRVHASHARLPLLGDVHYGGPKRLTLADGRVVSCHRVMLHCLRVSFPAMRSKEKFVFSTKVPSDMAGVFLALGGDENSLNFS